ncbi:hypothetical protein B0H15DRAFT_919883 [Mycena belliarum]|uniref:UBR-type domain-containing protein n=1 Tax=Mycena belliarum TaxID=1033014 RepID=A0AAD6ULA6_9AGAR|nr:hypothetical protein B0H15DRAFT_919883 [Mycena belliae]
MSETLAEYVASQDELVKEAGLALPHQFSQCTYALGPIRQAVYLCLTCPEARGLCAACSIACHTDHNQIELFPKRNFRCDCPTAAVAQPCALHTTAEPANTANHYGQNFHARFCRCGREYDAKTERETMIQCLSCEDWFHESCCMLRARPEPRQATPAPDYDAPTPGSDAIGADAEADTPDDMGAPPAPRVPDASTDGADAEDAGSVASSSGLPPPLISADDYDAFVCRACVRAIPTLRRVAGTRGVTTVVRESVGALWTRLGQLEAEEGNVDVVDAPSTSAGEKRPSSPHSEERATKRSRTEFESSFASASKPCLAPPPEPRAQAAYATAEADWDWDADTVLCTGDVFLGEAFRARWCRCATCLPSLEAHAYLLEEEETYEPPEDPDSGLSLEELGMRALARLPRERAIDGIHAFNAMRDNLRAYLRPFAEAGKVVDEADVQTFFEQLNETRAKSATVRVLLSTYAKRLMLSQ